MKRGTPLSDLSFSGSCMSLRCSVMYDFASGLRNVETGTERAGTSTVPFDSITTFCLGEEAAFSCECNRAAWLKKETALIASSIETDLRINIYPSYFSRLAPQKFLIRLGNNLITSPVPSGQNR